MIRVRQIKVLVEKNNEKEIKRKLSKKLNINAEKIVSYKILKKSIDSRDKDNIYYVYELCVKLTSEKNIKFNNDISIYKEDKYNFVKTGDIKLKNNIVIVGSGPAGLFSAYMLASYGYKPIIIERGEKTEDRIKSVSDFWKTGNLNINSNVQFGEGGAGTFSDGKLNTLIKDIFGRGKKVFEILVECGANEEILYENKPHIGTDLLRKVIINMRNKIISMGGKFLYNTTLTNIDVENNKLKRIEINNSSWIDVDLAILAIGHSARDTFSMLKSHGINMKPKPFAVGIRVIHNQDMINNSQYGSKYKNILGPASYKLTYNSCDGKGVYSFCMCPGGYVVNASSEYNHLAVNGMSNHDRDSGLANSAIVITVSPDDFGPDTLDGIEFQRKLEEKAYTIGSGMIPVQLLSDFKNNRISTNFKSVNPIFKGKYKFSNIRELLGPYYSNLIEEAFNCFGKKIEGFDNDDTVLAGIESRTSSPITIIRNDEFESNISGIYPCGEGCGYAGGITSAAIDGIKVFEHIASKYTN